MPRLHFGALSHMLMVKGSWGGIWVWSLGTLVSVSTGCLLLCVLTTLMDAEGCQAPALIYFSVSPT